MTPGPADRTPRHLALGVWCAWVVVATVTAVRHEMWRDEVQAWGIARGARWPWSMLGAVRAEGTPPGWHLVLWLPARVFDSPAVAQVIVVACGATAAWFVLHRMPIAFGWRAAIVFSYFPLYELSGIARSYGVLWMTVVVFLVLRDRHDARTGSPGIDRPMLATAVVAALLTPVGIPLAVGLAASSWQGWRGRSRRAWITTAALGTAVAVLALAALPLASRARKRLDVPSARDLGHVLESPARALFPVPGSRQWTWNSSVLSHLGPLGAIAGIAVVVLVAVAVRSSRRAVFIWLVGVVPLVVAIALLSLWDANRHISPMFMAFVAAVWTWGRDRAVVVAGRGWVVAAGVLAAGSLVTSAWLTAEDWRGTFSGGEATADWLDGQPGREPVLLCAAPIIHACTGIAVRLDRAVYVRPGEPPFTYLDFRRSLRRRLPDDELVEYGAALRERTGRSVVVIVDGEHLPPGCRPLVSSGPTLAEFESLALCRLSDIERAVRRR